MYTNFIDPVGVHPERLTKLRRLLTPYKAKTSQLNTLIAQLRASASKPHANQAHEFSHLLAARADGSHPEIYKNEHATHARQHAIPIFDSERPEQNFNILGLTYTDALQVAHAGVPMIMPQSIDVEAITMAIGFGVLLPIFEIEFAKDPAQVFTLLLITCLVIYPLIFKLFIWWHRDKINKGNFHDFTLSELVHEGFRLYAVLSASLIGLNLFVTPYLEAGVAAGIAAPLSEILNRLATPTEWSWTIFYQMLRNVAAGAVTFMGIISALKYLPMVLPAVNPYMQIITPFLIIAGLSGYGKYIVDGLFRIFADNHYYTYPLMEVVVDTGGQQLGHSGSDRHALVGVESQQ